MESATALPRSAASLVLGMGSSGIILRSEAKLPSLRRVKKNVAGQPRLFRDELLEKEALAFSLLPITDLLLTPPTDCKKLFGS